MRLPAAPGLSHRRPMTRRPAVALFAAFAFTYFFSALVRAVIATLAPVFSDELGLTAADLGLLAGTYFLGFALIQLPLGSALDRFGPKRVLLGFLAVAVLGCALFAQAQTFAGLTAARALIGIGVGACLMAPMTSYRLRFQPQAQMRAASWMLMTGSLGMVASTLPVQWVLPSVGWRGMFWLLAGLFAFGMAAIAWVVPPDASAGLGASRSPQAAGGGYRAVFAHPTFRRFLPMAFFHYGGLLALQSLWIGPWLSRVCGWTPQAAAGGLFALNLSMLFSFLAWGVLVPRLYARGWTAQSLIARGLPVSLALLLLALVLGEAATVPVWATFCVCSTLITLAQPAVGQAFDPALAGRALSAFNLVVFAGVFALQWTIGGAIDLLQAVGWGVADAFRGAFGLLAAGCIGAYVWFLWCDDAPKWPRSAQGDG